MFDLKIFLINPDYYAFRGLASDEIIKYITDNYKRKLHKDEIDVTKVAPKLTTHSEKDYRYWCYSYNQLHQREYWKVFLPEELTPRHTFDITEFSLVVFIEYNNSIFCVISGSGMNVIRTFVHPTFGVEIYQRIAKPDEDIIIGLEARSVTSNISQKKNVYTFSQILADSFQYSDVPKKLKLIIRNELKQKEFLKYDLSEKQTVLEVGAYFFIRKKLSFHLLKELVKDLDNIKHNYKPQQLTLFNKVEDNSLNEDLDNQLKEDMVGLITRYTNLGEYYNNQQEVIELIPPSKLEQFFECDSYKVRFKGAREDKFLSVKYRSRLYSDCTKYLYDSLKNINDREEIKGKLFTLNIIGQRNDKEVTFGNLFSHLNAEIFHKKHKYFRIDNNWYQLEDNLMEQISHEAKTYYQDYRLDDSDILLKWSNGIREDQYNLSHSHLDGHFVLDKITRDNVELCDIFVIKQNIIHLIHVKNGFGTTMRELYIQVLLAANRLWTDIKGSKESKYLLKTLEAYNKKNPSTKIDANGTVEMVRKGNIKINFVMAFKNNSNLGHDVLTRIELSKSNIAKYCLVSIVKEFRNIDFGLSLLDISERD